MQPQLDQLSGLINNYQDNDIDASAFLQEFDATGRYRIDANKGGTLFDFIFSWGILSAWLGLVCWLVAFCFYYLYDSSNSSCDDVDKWGDPDIEYQVKDQYLHCITRVTLVMQNRELRKFISVYTLPRHYSLFQQSIVSPHSSSSLWLHSGPGFQVIPLCQSVFESTVDLSTENRKHIVSDWVCFWIWIKIQVQSSSDLDLSYYLYEKPKVNNYFVNLVNPPTYVCRITASKSCFALTF